MNTPQYFTTGPPDQSPHTPQHEYYPQLSGPPMPPPPPLPEPPGTSNVSLDPMLQPHPLPHAPPPPIANEPQGSEAIINAAKAERSAQDRERGRLRVQRFRMKRKLADAEAGRRDKETLKKIKFPAVEAQVSAGLDSDQTSALYVDASSLVRTFQLFLKLLFTCYRRVILIMAQDLLLREGLAAPKIPRPRFESVNVAGCEFRRTGCGRSWPRRRREYVMQ